MNDGENLGSRPIDFRVNENLLRHGEPLGVGPRQLAVEIDLDDLFGARVAHAQFARSASADQHAIRAGNARADMTEGGVRQVKPAKDATGARDALGKGGKVGQLRFSREIYSAAFCSSAGFQSWSGEARTLLRS